MLKVAEEKLENLPDEKRFTTEEVTANDIAKMIVPGDTGVYIVGTGSSGAAQTFLFLGIRKKFQLARVTRHFSANFFFRKWAKGAILSILGVLISLISQ